MELVEMAMKPSSHGLLRDQNAIIINNNNSQDSKFYDLWQGVKDKDIAFTK